MRARYVQIDGELVPVNEAAERAAQEPGGPFIQGPVKPFISMLDGKEVTSLAKYRADIKARGYIEVGNEIDHLMKPRPAPEDTSRKELIAAQIRELGYHGVKKALKRDIDFIRWNSRKE